MDLRPQTVSSSEWQRPKMSANVSYDVGDAVSKRKVFSENGSSDSSDSDSQMRGLLNEFRGIYEGRLKKLDEAEKAGQDTQKVSLQYV